MRVTAGSGGSNVVDMYNSASGTWSTAQLSVARSGLAAISVENVAIFAGGDVDYSFTLFVEGLVVWADACGRWRAFACLRRGACCLLCFAEQEVAV
jgi:hypothetical protein